MDSELKVYVYDKDIQVYFRISCCNILQVLIKILKDGWDRDLLFRVWPTVEWWTE